MNAIAKKYVKEIETWKKKEDYKEKIGLNGYPKTPITPEQYEMFREEGETPKILFGGHYIKGRVK